MIFGNAYLMSGWPAWFCWYKLGCHWLFKNIEQYHKPFLSSWNSYLPLETLMTLRFTDKIPILWFSGNATAISAINAQQPSMNMITLSTYIYIIYICIYIYHTYIYIYVDIHIYRGIQTFGQTFCRVFAAFRLQQNARPYRHLSFGHQKHYIGFRTIPICTHVCLYVSIWWSWSR